MASWLFEEVNLPPRSGTKPLEARAAAVAASPVQGEARAAGEQELILTIARALKPILAAANASMVDDTGRSPELDVKISGEVINNEHVRVFVSIAGGLKVKE